MLPWTRSAWFRRAVTGVSTAFVAVVLATSLLAEGSALKRHTVPFASIKCPHGLASGRSRPQGGCVGHAIVIKPKGAKGGPSIRVDYAALAHEMSSMPRFSRPGARGLRGLRGPRGTGGAAGRAGKGGPRGHTGVSGPSGATGQHGAMGAAGSRGADGSRGPQ